MTGGRNWDWNLAGWLEHVSFEFSICLSTIIRACLSIIIYRITPSTCYKILAAWHFYSNTTQKRPSIIGKKMHHVLFANPQPMQVDIS